MKPHTSLKFLLFATLLCHTTPTVVTADDAPPLSRRAQWDARFEPLADAGRRITELNAGSPLAQAGAEVGDILVRVDGQSIASAARWDDLSDALVAGRAYQLSLRRDHAILELSATFDPVPQESYDGLEVTYDQIVSDYGVRQRVIITRPERTTGRQPAIFVLQGLSCSSIEYWPGRTSNFIRTLRHLISQSGMVVMRTEKPGLGDSEGNCSQTDFQTELNGYETALAKLMSLDYVDQDRILVYGSSMGSALAPYFANKFGLNAVISDGTYYRTWFEHMLEIERRIKSFQGNDETTVNRMINRAYIPLYYGMLIQKKSYADVVDEQPLLADYNYHANAHMYGRPVAFYHQMQDFDVAGNWQRLSVPVRIRWGSSDWIMSEADNHMIMQALEKAGNTNAELLITPGLDHFDTIQPSMEASFRGDAGRWEEDIGEQLVTWAQELNQARNPRAGLLASAPEGSR